LAAAIRGTFGKQAVMQRCKVRRRRNVCDHLPESMKQHVSGTMSAAYRCSNFERAKRMLNALVRQLEKKS
jgi:hypothetical protein